MLFAPIVPPSICEILTDLPSEYHFALGQELTRSDKYLNQYKLLGNNGAFIIVDNGAAEYDSTVPFRDIVSVANHVGASEIVMPDVLLDCNETISRTTNRRNLALVTPERRMIVPQGTTIREWYKCLVELDARLQGAYQSIGVAKHLEVLSGGRPGLLRIIQQYGLGGHPIHLLGVYLSFGMEVYECWITRVPIRGIDTGFPVALAQLGVGMWDEALVPPRRVSLDWSAETDHKLALQNIQKVYRITSGFTF